MRSVMVRVLLVSSVAAISVLVGCGEKEGGSRDRDAGGGQGDVRVGDADRPDGAADAADATDADDADVETIVVPPPDTGADTGMDECRTNADCPAPMGAEGTCNDDGRCVVDCRMGYVDLDGDLAGNGCECQVTNGGDEACDGKDNDCDGEVDEDVDTSTDPMNCGECGNVCQVPHAKNVCKQGACQTDGCQMGWHDLNGKSSDGCEYECTARQADDVPDQSGTDANCDGIDGVKSDSVFVALPANGGSNGNTGRSTSDPVATISKGISIAEKCSPACDVLVSAGTYQERVELVAEVDVYGGYGANSWDRDVSTHQTIIRGPTRRTVVARDIFNPTEFDGFTVEGKRFAGNGRSSYAIWVKNSLGDNLVIDHVRVEAGSGGAGSDGTDGSNGADGNDGGSATGTSDGRGGASACGAGGGNGGAGTNNCTRSPGKDGQNGGDGTAVGSGGYGGAPECGGCNDSGNDGGVGRAGANGQNGSGGSGATDQSGQFSGAGFWDGDGGTSGSRGRNGGGGGGGGAGGKDEDGFVCGGQNYIGGGGGGGGAGGCAGRGGQPGGPGGGAFGLVLLGSDIVVKNTTIVLGSGGEGGDGGLGGNGGRGGDPGSGAGGQGEAGDGARGGDGGAGGGGGGGAGACGGPAIGMALVNGSDAKRTNVNFKGGRGGAGGNGGRGGYRGDRASRARNGTDGCKGTKENVLKY